MYPSLSVVRELERHTLKRITQISEFGRLGQLQSAAHAAVASVHEHAGGVNINLGFTLDIRLRGDKKGRPVTRRLDLGALIEAAADRKTVRNASYSLLICRYADPIKSPIVRKMHFDYEPLEYREDAEPKPSAHLQVCGKLSPHHVDAGYTELKLRAMYPAWEKPRIPLAPTSVALILNWLLLEFQNDPASQGVLNSPDWRTLVAHAERTVLIPYFKAAAQFLDSAADKKRRFLQTHVYNLSVD